MKRLPIVLTLFAALTLPSALRAESPPHMDVSCEHGVITGLPPDGATLGPMPTRGIVVPFESHGVTQSTLEAALSVEVTDASGNSVEGTLRAELALGLLVWRPVAELAPGALYTMGLTVDWSVLDPQGCSPTPTLLETWLYDVDIEATPTPLQAPTATLDAVIESSEQRTACCHDDSLCWTSHHSYALRLRATLAVPAEAPPWTVYHVALSPDGPLHTFYAAPGTSTVTPAWYLFVTLPGAQALPCVRVDVSDPFSDDYAIGQTTCRAWSDLGVVTPPPAPMDVCPDKPVFEPTEPLDTADISDTTTEPADVVEPIADGDASELEPAGPPRAAGSDDCACSSVRRTGSAPLAPLGAALLLGLGALALRRRRAAEALLVLSCLAVTATLAAPAAAETIAPDLDYDVLCGQTPQPYPRAGRREPAVDAGGRDPRALSQQRPASASELRRGRGDGP